MAVESLRETVEKGCWVDISSYSSPLQESFKFDLGSFSFDVPEDFSDWKVRESNGLLYSEFMSPEGSSGYVFVKYRHGRPPTSVIRDFFVSNIYEQDKQDFSVSRTVHVEGFGSGFSWTSEPETFVDRRGGLQDA
tara:strand:- start:73 stop:477 length:405 start_codon:yes stop_codon:yes gene_type:complete